MIMGIDLTGCTATNTGSTLSSQRAAVTYEENVIGGANRSPLSTSSTPSTAPISPMPPRTPAVLATKIGQCYTHRPRTTITRSSNAQMIVLCNKPHEFEIYGQISASESWRSDFFTSWQAYAYSRECDHLLPADYHGWAHNESMPLRSIIAISSGPLPGVSGQAGDPIPCVLCKLADRRIVPSIGVLHHALSNVTPAQAVRTHGDC